MEFSISGRLTSSSQPDLLKDVVHARSHSCASLLQPLLCSRNQRQKILLSQNRQQIRECLFRFGFVTIVQQQVGASHLSRNQSSSTDLISIFRRDSLDGGNGLLCPFESGSSPRH